MASPSSSVLQQLSRLDQSSPEFPNQLDELLRGQEYGQCAPYLQSDDSKRVIDYFDEALDRLDPSSDASKNCLSALKEICGARRILPTSYEPIPDSELKDIDNPRVVLLTLDLDDYHKVSQATLGDGSKVRARRIGLERAMKPEITEQIFWDNAVMFKYLKHPNIAPFLGFMVKPFQYITEWTPNGDLSEYIEKHPAANRVQLLSDVAEGISYLHSRDMIHGEIMGLTVLVDAAGRARITDFGFGMVTLFFTSGRGSYRYHYLARWKSPEALFGNLIEERYTKALDIFSFAMLMVEVFTGTIPFNDLVVPGDALRAIENGRRPSRPTHPALTETLWDLMQRCWDQDPCLRPDAAEVSGILRASL